ncbi:class I lanthipeptide [Chitinophaga flava]|uniref:class I lanthipeptide n=1 Tax=Chitinophaga flava TaxID=2259036 RepID=UPI001293073A|nr:class I lanthipeptide [Chitinophaga flava]
MKKKKIALAKKLMLNKTTVNSLSEQKNQSEGRISYHTFINCDEEARRNGYFC